MKKMIDRPLVSVCIPTYNGEKYIQECLLTVINQTYNNLEIIISDDNSSDNTIDKINDLLKEHRKKTKIKIYNHFPSSIGSNWNNSISKANGKYIKLVFQDDLLYPNCIERLLTEFLNNDHIGLISSKRRLITSSESIRKKNQQWIGTYSNLQKGLEKYFVSKNNFYELKKDILRKSIFFKMPYNKVGEPTLVLFKKSDWEKIGGFNEQLVQRLDYEFYYRFFLLNKSIIILNEELACFRIHPQQATNLNRKKKIKDHSILTKIYYNDFFHLLSNYKKLSVYINLILARKGIPKRDIKKNLTDVVI